MEPKKAAAVVAASLVVAIGAVELAVGDRSVATVLIRTDATGEYAYKERIITAADPVRSDGKSVTGATLAGETLIQIVTSVPCAGGNEAKCLAGGETTKVSPCVRAVGLDCFRQSPLDKAPRFFGLNNTFLATEATGTQCSPTPCAVIAGDDPKVAK